MNTIYRLRVLRTIILGVVLLCWSALAYAQGGGTSMGTEFWTAYMTNTNPPGGDQGSNMYLYITSDVNTTGVVSITDGSLNQEFSVTANQVTTIQLPANAYLATEGTFNKGIHITAANPIAVYAHIFAEESSGATLLLPVNTMGKDYYSINYTQLSDFSSSLSALMVIATEDTTTIQITPLVATAKLKPVTVTLKKGQVYELLNPTDLTGTRIQSIGTGTSPCKKIAVFSGSTRVQIGCPNNSSDNLFQQVYPTSSWGEKYITVPLKNRPYDVIRVIMSDPNTVLTINGQTIDPSKFASTMFYEFNSSSPNTIIANKPVQAVQYAVTEGNTPSCTNDENDIGDPEMIFLTPIEQSLNHVTLYSTSNYKILQSYINVLIPSNGVPSFILDGAPYTTFTPISLGYAYAQIPVKNGTHNISAGVGFNAIAYGFGVAESYGYAAGANLANLNEFMALQNLQTDSLQYNGCTNEKYNLQLALPYKTTQITWDLRNGAAPLVQNNPVVTSTKVNGTVTLYSYQYPKNPVVYSKKGNYTVGVTVVNTGPDDCGSTEPVSFNFNISNLPDVNFEVDNTYVGAGTSFKDETVPDTTIKTWYWDFGDGQTSGAQNPVHAYKSPGKYTVNETVTDVDGCSSSIQKVININIVVSPLNGTIIACQGSASTEPYVDNFSVTAGSLTAPLIIQPPLGFEVSLTPDNGYTASITLSPSGGAVNNSNIYIRSAANAPLGSPAGIITIASSGVQTMQLPVAAIINLVPEIQPVANVSYKNGQITPGIPFSGNGNLFTWTNDMPSIGLPASGTGYIPPFTAINNTGTTNVTANITAKVDFATLAYITVPDSNKVSLISTATNAVISNIKVSGFPEGVAVSPATGRVYVSDAQSATVSVIDAHANAVTATINVGSGPFGLCVSSDGSRIYVANSDTGTVSVINAASNLVTATVKVGDQPVGVIISPDGSKVYVSNSLSATISVINTQNNQVVATISTDAYPFDMVFSPDGKTLYASNNFGNTISVIDVSSNRVTSAIKNINTPSGIDISPDGTTIYVANLKTNSVSVINAATGNVVTTIPVGASPYGLTMSKDGSTVYVANQASGTVSVIDTRTNKALSPIETGGGPRAFGKFIIAGSGCQSTPVHFQITVFPTPPVQITATGNIGNLTTTYGTPSAPGTFTVSGKHTVSPISVIAPAGFELSKDNSSFDPTVSLGDTGTVAATTIYTRIKATTAVGTYPNDTVKIAAKNTDTLKNMVVPLGTVTPATLTVKADDKSRIYDEPNPALTVSYTGFVNNEDASVLTSPPAVSTTATILSPVGKYVINVDSAAAVNYAFNYIPGTLTVTPSAIVVPNTFTPNGDGINDVWNIKYLDYYPRCTVDIFNRYGQKLFHSVGYAIPWDGTLSGKALSTGTYYYIINLQNGTPPLSGYVAIIK